MEPSSSLGVGFLSNILWCLEIGTAEVQCANYEIRHLVCWSEFIATDCRQSSLSVEQQRTVC